MEQREAVAQNDSSSVNNCSIKLECTERMKKNELAQATKMKKNRSADLAAGDDAFR